MDAQDFTDLGKVFTAGARRTWGWQNPVAAVFGTVLEAMARECDAIADERGPRGE